MELKKPLNFDNFISLIEANALFERKKKWKILCLLTDLDDFSEIKNELNKYNYDLKYFGDVLNIIFTPKRKGELIRKKEKFFGYIIKNKNLYYFFSKENKEDIEKYFIKHFLNKVKHIYYLWIQKILIENLIDDFENKYKEDLFISEFHSERDVTEFINSYFRENIKRKITYTGRDGIKTLKELKYYYGVRPHIIDFDINGLCSFRINKDGFFTYYSGELNFLLSVIEKTYFSSQDMLELTFSSKIEEIEIKDLKARTINLQPIIIQFTNYILNENNIDDFISSIKNYGFEVFNQGLKIGSIRFNCDIIDTAKKAIFSITSGGYDLIVTPQYKTTFDTIFRFMECLSDNIDSEIKYEAYTHPILVE